jgi:hypothetical protein
MGWFFKHNTNSNLDHKPLWNYVTVLEPLDYWCAIALVVLFCILFFLLLAGLPVLPFITMSICIISGLNYMGTINNKRAYCYTIIKDLFKYYKVSMMYIFSLFVIISAFANLGTIPGLFSIFTIVLIYFNVIHIDLFKAASEDGLTQLVTNKQAKKVCSFKDDNSKKHGLLYNLIIGNNGQAGGGNIAKQLKKIGNYLSK